MFVCECVCVSVRACASEGACMDFKEGLKLY